MLFFLSKLLIFFRLHPFYSFQFLPFFLFIGRVGRRPCVAPLALSWVVILLLWMS